jgi:putative ABC transport system substrate-binding protein
VIVRVAARGLVGRLAILFVGALLTLVLATRTAGFGTQVAGRTATIGYLALVPPTAQTASVWDSFVRELSRLGWTPGQNLSIESRFAAGNPERLAGLAAELAALRVSAIVASGLSAVQAAKNATSTIPVVIAGAADPVAFGLVESLAHPGGNVTGVADSAGREIEGKRLQLLKEALPHVSRVGVILDSPSRRDPGTMHAAAKALGLSLLVSPETADVAGFRGSFALLRRERVEALYAPETPVNARHRDLIVSLAAEHRLPTLYGAREFVEAGGFMSYGASFVDLYRRAAVYVDRILRGAKPADLPVEQPTKFELVVNLKTAKALGLTIPQSVLVRADEILQ